MRRCGGLSICVLATGRPVRPRRSAHVPRRTRRMLWPHRVGAHNRCTPCIGGVADHTLTTQRTRRLHHETAIRIPEYAAHLTTGRTRGLHTGGIAESTRWTGSRLDDKAARRIPTHLTTRRTRGLHGKRTSGIAESTGRTRMFHHKPTSRIAHRERLRSLSPGCLPESILSTESPARPWRTAHLTWGTRRLLWRPHAWRCAPRIGRIALPTRRTRRLDRKPASGIARNPAHLAVGRMDRLHCECPGLMAKSTRRTRYRFHGKRWCSPCRVRRIAKHPRAAHLATRRARGIRRGHTCDRGRSPRSSGVCGVTEHSLITRWMDGLRGVRTNDRRSIPCRVRGTVHPWATRGLRRLPRRRRRTPARARTPGHLGLCLCIPR